MDSGVVNEHVDLAKVGSAERSWSHDIMGLGQEEPSFDFAYRSDSRRCDSVSHSRATRANARGLLGRDCDLGHHAGYSWRDADALGRSDRGHRRGCVNWSARDKLLRGKSGCLRACDHSHRITVDRVSFGEDCVSLREHYAFDYRSHPALGSGLDHRAAKIP
jgi:hypothetical protein